MKRYILAVGIVLIFCNNTFAASDIKAVEKLTARQEAQKKSLEASSALLELTSDMTKRFDVLKQLIERADENKKLKPQVIKSFKKLISDFDTCYNDEKLPIWQFNTEATKKILEKWNTETQSALKKIDQKGTDICTIIDGITTIAIQYEQAIQNAVLESITNEDDSVGLFDGEIAPTTTTFLKPKSLFNLG